MARKFLTPIDLNNLELQNVKIQNLADNPAIATTGKIYFNTASSQLRVYNGSSWANVGSNPTAGDGISVSGSQISIDLAATSGLEVASGDGLRVDLDSSSGLALNAGGLAVDLASGGGLYKPTGALAIQTAGGGGLTVTSSGIEIDFADTSGLEVVTSGLRVKLGSGLEFGLADYAIHVDTDTIATKMYVDSVAQGLDVKGSVFVATTSSINVLSDLEAGDMIDGKNLTAGQRVLVKNQGDAKENGIYIVSSSGSANRASDLAQSSDAAGAFTFVEQGDTNAGKGFVVTSYPATVDSDGLTWTQFSESTSLSSGNGIQILGSTVSVDLSDTSLEFNSGKVRVNLATTSGLTVDNPDGLKIQLASGAGATSGLALQSYGLELDLATTSGLEIAADDGLRIDLANEPGLELSASGLKVLLDNTSTTSGLTIGASGLKVDVATTSGLGFDETGLKVALTAMPGLELSAMGLAAKAATDGGISVGLSGLSVDLATTSGLEIQSSEGLRIDLATSSGLALDSNGLAIDLAATSYLLLENDGLKVDTSSNGGIARTYRAILTGASTSYTVTHNFATNHVVVQVFETDSPYATVEADVERTSGNAVAIKFAVAPTSGQYSVTVIG